MKTKPFYSWVILVALFLIYFASNGIMQNTMPAVLRAAAGEFKIDQADATKLPSLVFFIMAILLPFVGFLATKISPKKLLVYGCFILAGAILYYPYVYDYNSLRAFYIIFPVGLSIAGLLTSMIILTNWFSKNIGLAMGIFLNASSIGAAIFNPIAGTWIKELGWRTTGMNLSYISVAFLLIPLVFIFAKPIKEVVPAELKNTNIIETKSFIKELFSVNYLIVLLVTALCWFVITGFIFNQQFYLKQLNLDAKASGKIAGLFFLCSLLGKILFGFLGDRFSKKWILIFSILNLLIGVFLLKYSINNPSIIYTTAIAMGIGYSGCFTMIQLIIAHLYKGDIYSKLLGFATMIDTLAASFGIMLTGKWAKENSGYEYPFTIYIYIIIAALLVSFLIRSKQKEND
jgi:MFS transporter, OFA family, oxalate/formate antiporter